MHRQEIRTVRELPKFLTAYRSILRVTTGVRPAKLLFGPEIRNKIPGISTGYIATAADEYARENDGFAKQKGKEYADDRRPN